VPKYVELGKGELRLNTRKVPADGATPEKIAARLVRVSLVSLPSLSDASDVAHVK